MRDERSEEWEDGRMGGGRGMRSGRMGGGRGVRSGRSGRRERGEEWEEWEDSLLDGVRQDGCV